MHRTGDLHLQKEIFTLFDFTNNELSKSELIDLLSTLPDSLEIVLFRQDVLKALLQHPFLFNLFSYSGRELSEVYNDTLHNRNRTILLQESRVKMHWPFSSVRSQKERGKLLQMLSFFSRIRKAYFQLLDKNLFPVVFAVIIGEIEHTFNVLEIDGYDPAGKSNIPKVSVQIALMKNLNELVRTGKMKAFWNAFFLFEAYLSIAKGIRRHHFIFPRFTASGISIMDFYHPQIKQPVKNSISFTNQVMLLTGPNMSGKSTLLRSVGVCVYLAHLGLAVPARVCELAFFDIIFISIDLNDDLLSGYSHFMSEVIALKKVVLQARAGKKCFAIFDELFRGTNSDDALQISYKTIAGLTQFTPCCFLISTHLHELRERLQAKNSVSFKHIDCALTNNKLVFTYLLKEGWSSLKIGQTIFDNEGLNDLLEL